MKNLSVLSFDFSHKTTGLIVTIFHTEAQMVEGAEIYPMVSGPLMKVAIMPIYLWREKKKDF